MNTKQLLEALDLKAIPCEYCDVRIEEIFESSLKIQNQELTTALEQSSVGAFLRVRKKGQWYYAATTDLQNLEAQLQALAQSSDIGPGTPWKFLPENQGRFENMSYQENNPSLVPLEEKVRLMQAYDAVARKTPKIKNTMTRYGDIYKVKTYKNTSGTFYQFDFAQCGFGTLITVGDDDKTYDDKYRNYGETFTKLKGLEQDIENYFKESDQFIHAPMLDAGKYNVVLTAEVAGVFVHESFGHNSEADGMVGDPQAKEIWKLGKKVAADFVSIVDSGLHKGGSGYCPIDDEGFPATKTYLIKDGILTGRLHSFDTAMEMDEKPTGNARALNFEFQPIVRMTSTYIENGNLSLDELFKKAEGGLFVQDYKYGTGGEMFTIAPGRAYLIKDGKPSVPVRANVVSGQLFETLLNIEALADDFTLSHSALGGCGKMDQFPLPVSDGGPTILVKNMQVS